MITRKKENRDPAHEFYINEIRRISRIIENNIFLRRIYISLKDYVAQDNRGAI